MRIAITLSIVLLVSLVVTGQNVQINQKLEPSPLPDYFVLKNNPDTIFAKVGRQRYKLVNGRFVKVKIKTAKGKKVFSASELQQIQSFRINGIAVHRHTFDKANTESLKVLSDGPLLLMSRTEYVEYETEEDTEWVPTESFYWWHAGQLNEVDAAAITKVVNHLSTHCGIQTNSPGTLNKSGLIELTKLLNTKCPAPIVWQ